MIFRTNVIHRELHFRHWIQLRQTNRGVFIVFVFVLFFFCFFWFSSIYIISIIITKVVNSIALVYVNKEVNFPQKCLILAVLGSPVYALWLTCSQRLLNLLTFESFDYEYECTWCVSIDITFVVFTITEQPDQNVLLKWVAEISQWTTPLPTIPCFNSDYFGLSSIL